MESVKVITLVGSTSFEFLNEVTIVGIGVTKKAAASMVVNFNSQRFYTGASGQVIQGINVEDECTFAWMPINYKCKNLDVNTSAPSSRVLVSFIEK